MAVRLRRALASAVLAAALTSGFAHAAQSAPVKSYAKIEEWRLPGSTHGNRIAFDSHNRHLFVTHGDRVDILDVDTGKIVGTIGGLNDARAVAFAPDLSRGFVTDGPMGTVVSFDLTTFGTFGTTQVGPRPDVMAYESTTKRLFVANRGDNTLTVIDAVVGMVLGHIDLVGEPSAMAANGLGKVYVAIKDRSQLAVIDAAHMTLKANHALEPACENPTDMAIDEIHRRLFVGCANKAMIAVNTQTDKLIDTIPLGGQSDSVGVNAFLQLAFSANDNGTLTVAAPATSAYYKVVDTLATRTTARALAVDPLRFRVYLAAVGKAEPAPKSQHASTKPGGGLTITAFGHPLPKMTQPVMPPMPTPELAPQH